jgi:hypothetical protein
VSRSHDPAIAVGAEGSVRQPTLVHFGITSEVLLTFLSLAKHPAMYCIRHKPVRVVGRCECRQARLNDRLSGRAAASKKTTAYPDQAALALGFARPAKTVSRSDRDDVELMNPIVRGMTNGCYSLLGLQASALRAKVSTIFVQAIMFSSPLTALTG